MKIELTKNEVVSIMTKHVIAMFNIDMDGKTITAQEYFGGFKLNVEENYEHLSED